MEQQLKDLIMNKEPQEAPKYTNRYGKHYEWIIGIGSNETASITMTEEAFNELKNITLDFKDCNEC